MPTIVGSSSDAFQGSQLPIARPSGVTAGDVMVAFHTCDNDTLAEMGLDGGWTLLASREAEAGGGTKVWRRVASATEPSMYEATQGATADGVVAIVALRDASTAKIVVAQTGSTGQITIEATTPAATPKAAGCTDLRWAAAVPAPPGASVSWEVPSEYTRLREEQSQIYATGILAWRSLTGNAPVGQVVFEADDVFDITYGFTVLVPPAAGDTPTEPPSPPPTIPAISSAEQVVSYTYVFADLLTDADICKDLDLYDVSYTRRINEAGTFSARLTITDEVTAAKVARVVPRHPEDLSTGPGRSLVHVYRNGVIWGSYVIWRASVSRQGRGQPIEVSIEGASLESFLTQVKIRDDLGPYEGEDQIVIARSLLQAMQSTPRYDISLNLQEGMSGYPRDYTYLASEAQTYGDAITDLAQVANGFEWAIQTVDNGDETRSRFWTWGFPQLGSATPAHTFQEPGDVLSWSEDIDALRGGTAFQVRGESINDDASAESQALVSDVVLAQAHIDAGWPGIDVTTDRSGVSDVTELNAHAAWQAANQAGTVRVHQATVRLPANTSFGPGNLGDQVTIMLVNPWWPVADGVASFAKSWRVVGMAFTPPAKGSGQEVCTLTFEENGES